MVSLRNLLSFDRVLDGKSDTLRGTAHERCAITMLVNGERTIRVHLTLACRIPAQCQIRHTL